MNYQVLTTSTYAKLILDETNHGMVHSVYRNTVNVSFGKHLLALQTKNSPLSPISLITDLDSSQMDQLSLSPKDHITINLNENTLLVNLSPEVFFPKHYRQELFSKIRRSVISSNTAGFDLIFQHSDLIENDIILKNARKCIEKAYALYRKEQIEEACILLSRLIGLGIGLTPSGDDFLCGILAGLSLLNRQNHSFTKCLHYYMKQNLKNTNEISQTFLRCALQNQFSSAVNLLWTNPSSKDISGAFRAIGHSSGMDTLCGVYYAFLLCQE